MAKLNNWVRYIEFLSDKAGILTSFLLLPLMVITFIEVFARYFLNSPTIWAWDVNIQLFGLIIIFGGAYAYRHNMHVRVDVLFAALALPRRTQAVISLITSTIVFLTLFALLIFSSQEAWYSFVIREKASSVWAPPVYPLKAIIPLAIFLFLLQGIAHVLRNILVILHQEEC